MPLFRGGSWHRSKVFDEIKREILPFKLFMPALEDILWEIPQTLSIVGDSLNFPYSISFFQTRINLFHLVHKPKGLSPA